MRMNVFHLYLIIHLLYFVLALELFIFYYLLGYLLLAVPGQASWWRRRTEMDHNRKRIEQSYKQMACQMDREVKKKFA